MTTMRAKLRIAEVGRHETAEVLRFTAVGASQYPADGSDEDNTFAKFTPSAEMTMTICNPALLGKFNMGDVYYVDFTPIETK